MALDPRQIEVVDDKMAEILRSMTGAERLKIASDMFSSARRMLIHALQAEHPEWDEQAVHAEAARRLLQGTI